MTNVLTRERQGRSEAGKRREGTDPEQKVGEGEADSREMRPQVREHQGPPPRLVVVEGRTLSPSFEVSRGLPTP